MRIAAYFAAVVFAACGANVATPPPPSVTSTDVSEVDAQPDIGADAAPADVSTAAPGCVVAADCPGKTEQCLSGTCVAQTACQSDKQCQSVGLVCEKGAKVCVQCLQSADCDAGFECKANHCLAPPTTCVSTKECAPGQVCDKAAKACVECVASTDCNEGAICVETVCIPEVCKPGTAQCAGISSLNTCAANGAGWEESPCSEGTACEDGVCKPTVCTAGGKSCEGNFIVTCNARGTATTGKTACAVEQVCVAGECAAAACKAGSAQCQGGQVATCKADGTGWDAKACGPGKVCVEGGCVAKVCDAGALYCEGSKQMKCDAVGAGGSLLFDCLAIQKEMSTCLGGQCVALACKPGVASCADSATVATCKADGSGYDKSPCGAGKACVGGNCEPVVCKAGEVFCVGAKVATCNSWGTGSQNGVDCAASGKVCEVGACVVAKVCVPGAKGCQAAGLGTCKLDGSGWDVASCDDANPCTLDGCASSACTAANAADGVACPGGACKGGLCQAKLCGNGNIEVGEQCDDGNTADGDGCSAACQTEAFASCAALQAKLPTKPDGVYLIDPDGTGPIAPAKLFCDMKAGGWTLVANIYDGAGDDVPNDPGLVLSGWQQTGSGAWQSSAGTIDRSTTVSAVWSLPAVAAMGKQAVQHGMRMCFVNQAGVDVQCRSTADGSLSLASYTAGNPKLTAYAGDMLTWTYGRLVGVAGSTDSYDASKLVNMGYFIPRTPGQAGEWGTAYPGLYEYNEAGCNTWTGVWHAAGCGISFRPWGQTDDELTGGANQCCGGGGNNPTPNGYGFRVYVGGHLCGNGIVEPGEQCDGSAGCDAQCWGPGDNKWRRYYTPSVAQSANSYIPGPYDFPAQAIVAAPDGTALIAPNLVPSNTYHVLRAWVYVDVATAIPVTLSKDDCASVWLNGMKLGGSPFGPNVAVTLQLPVGWSTVEYAFYNGPAGGHLTSDIVLSSKVKRLSSVPPWGGS